jgi:hypothetical protein
MLRLESTFLHSASGAGYDRLPIPAFGRRMVCTSSMEGQFGKKRSPRKVWPAFSGAEIAYVRSWNRSTPGAAGFFMLSQTLFRPDRYGDSRCFETMPTRPRWQASYSSSLSR